MKVCRYEQGNTSLFVCPYHSWSYTTDGKLQGVPLYRALYEGTLNREEWSLIEVPKLALYKGTVWASWDPEAPDFLTIWAMRSSIWIRCWIAATGGRAAPRSSACTNGCSRPTGNSPRRISSATPITIRRTARWT